MPIALVAHATAPGTASSGVTTSAIDTTGATLLVLALNRGGPTDNAVSDSKGNTWTPLTEYGTAVDDPATRFFYAGSPIVGPGHTFTLGALSGTFAPIAVAAFSGVAGSPFDVENGNVLLSAGTTIQPGSVTPGANGALVITTLGAGGMATASIDSGFTIIDTQPDVGGQSYAASLAYLVQPTAAPVNPTWTRDTSSVRTTAAIAVFAAIPGSATLADDDAGWLMQPSPVAAGIVSVW